MIDQDNVTAAKKFDPSSEALARTPAPLRSSGFNARAVLPHGLQVAHIGAVMQEFLNLLGHINQALGQRDYPRLETMLMPANFSSVVGEFMSAGIPKFCKTLSKNRYHNGHPDLIPTGMFNGDAVQHATEGIEIKASRYGSAWQGHNAEACWLMVFNFESNRPVDEAKGEPAKPFRFLQVCGAQLVKTDWKFSGRSETSRRTITASVLPCGFQKMSSNWIYKA